MNTETIKLKKQIRYMLLFFMVALAFSGATAIPVEEELRAVLPHLNAEGAIAQLLQEVYNAVVLVRRQYPFLMYGYDWLAFAHFVIAVAFIGPFKDPVRNIWVIEFGMIACVMVLPFALVFSAYRGLPFWWSLIDCSFGVFGILPLWYCHRKIKQLERLTAFDKLNLVF